MPASKLSRRKHAYAPWLAALTLGATAHLGILIHEHAHHSAAADHHVAHHHVAHHHAAAPPRASASAEPQDPDSRWLTAYIDRRGPGQFAIDHRALDRLAWRDFIGQTYIGVHLDGVEGSPLAHLGLHDGDRVLAVRAEHERGWLRRVDLVLDRDGRHLTFTYTVV